MATRIFHMSDPHFGAENREALNIFADAVRHEGADALLCTGDLTQRATYPQFEAAARFFEQFDVPVVICAGNHDMPYYNMWERLVDPYRRYRMVQRGVADAFASDDVVLVPLVSTVPLQPRFPWVDGLVRRQALQSTLAQLRSLAQDPRLKLVFCHHPLLPAQDGQKNPTIGGDNAFAQLAKAGAQAVISGHVHIPFDQQRERGGRSLRMLGAGTLSTRLRGVPPSFQILTCEADAGIVAERRIIAP